MKEKFKQDLLYFMANNPTLDVIPLVSEEVRNDDGYAMGVFDNVKVDEIAVDPYDDEHSIFKSSGAFNGFNDDYTYNDTLEREEIPDKEIEAAFNGLPWEKAIFVYIEE